MLKFKKKIKTQERTKMKKVNVSHINAIKESGLFDSEWYISHYHDVAKDGGEPIIHYLLFGANEKRNPGPLFDTSFYLKNNHDVAENGINALLHYILFGKSEGRQISPTLTENSGLSHPDPNIFGSLEKKHLSITLQEVNNSEEKVKNNISNKIQEILFDEDFYNEYYPDIKGNSINPREHFFTFGWKEGRNPNKLFNTLWYISQYPEAKSVNPLIHYSTVGWKRKYSPSFEFDAKKYYNKYLKNDVNFVFDPLTHYLTIGKEIGYNCFRFDYHRGDCNIIIESKLFSYEWYELKYPDMENQDSLLHYCIFGYKEGRNPNPFFNTNWYTNQYLDIGDENPLVHYITKGWKKNYSPSPLFSVKKYLEKHPEIKKSKVEPLKHFLTKGKNEGFLYIPEDNIESFKIDKKSSISGKLFNDLNGLFDYKFKDLKPSTNEFNSRNLSIHFVIPDFGIGGGGHLNIFRMVRYLEFFGHKLTIWIFKPTQHKNPQEAYNNIIRYYSTIKAEVKFVDEDFPYSIGDIILATSWDTVWPVQSVEGFKRRFYFVQDYETLFNAKGSRSELAEYTYTQDIDCICASAWLDELMRTKFKRWSSYYNLAADREIYYPTQREKNEIPIIAFYARIFTERRAVELGIIALELLAKEGIDFHVIFFGAEFNFERTPFSCQVFYKRTPDELANIYRSSDIGVVFSLTNYSLVPQEMMACGLPIVEFDTESTRGIYPEGVVLFSGPDPIDIKNKIKALLFDKEKQVDQSKKALEWVGKFSWEKSARDIEASFKNRLLELGFKDNKKDLSKTIKASIVIPTYNGGALIKTVIDKVKSQQVPWNYEVIVLDSESTDGTKEFVLSHTDIIFKTIKKQDFSHGGTRNYGAEIAKGEYVAFLTQDAIPLNDTWLYNMITILEHYPKAAGAFGKHIAHDDATFFTKKEIHDHFEVFFKLPLRVSINEIIPNGIPPDSWKHALHFYSDNNSCLRKSIWEKVPYRNVQYGEDQLWADDIIKAGYDKVYALTAVVKHSHDYEPSDVYERAKTDGDFFKYYWNYNLIDPSNIDSIIEAFIKNDKIIAFENGIPDSELEQRAECLKAKFRGYLDGQSKVISMFSKESEEKSKF